VFFSRSSLIDLARRASVGGVVLDERPSAITVPLYGAKNPELANTALPSKGSERVDLARIARNPASQALTNGATDDARVATRTPAFW